MTFSPFNTETHAKWILAGEHAVLRGHAALVFPNTKKTLTLTYTPTNYAVETSFAGSEIAKLQQPLLTVLNYSYTLFAGKLPPITGHFHITNNIPLGAGMGASAALCVAIARWFHHQFPHLNINTSQLGQKFEDLFHGKSSGLDIAGAAAETGLYFLQGITTPIQQIWSPIWALSFSGQMGKTATCIQHVQQLWQKNHTLAASIDLDMAKSVAQAHDALTHTQSLQQLTDAIKLGMRCFENWGLITPTLQEHMNYLTNAGAIATKPTGSGGGGYVLSLWDKSPINVSGLILQES